MRHLDIRLRHFFCVFSYEDTNPQRLSYCGMLKPTGQWIGPILTPVLPMVPNECFSFKFKVEVPCKGQGQFPPTR
jgi:hypothetical protein